MIEQYTLSITPLTPIRVGTGNVMTPGDYFIFPDDKDRIYVCDLGRIPAEEMGDLREEVLAWIQANPLTWLANVNKTPRLVELIKKHSSHTCRITKRCYEQILRRWGRGQSELAISTIHRTIHGPIIPGSSIKGAIRTALVYERAPEPLGVDGGTDSAKWERKALDPASDGEIQSDLLSALKVSDTDAAKASAWVVQPTHVGMADSAQEMQDYTECLPKADPESPYRLRFSLTIASGVLVLRDKKGKLSIQDVMRSCRHFYGDVLEAETAYWEDGEEKEARKALEVCADLRGIMDRFEDAALIRLGWGCGMNAVGMNIAKPRGEHPPRGVDPRYRYYPATRALLAGDPPGWALLMVEGR